MTALQKILESYRQTARTPREKGTYFEQLIICYLRNEASYKELYCGVWMYADWAREQGLDARDMGIDLVAQVSGTGEYHAIQCKLYAEEYRLQKKDIDSFFTASGKRSFTHRIIVSTTNNWSEHAEDALRDQQPPVSKIDLLDLENSQIDWSRYGPDAPPTLKPRKTLRPHQERALVVVQEKMKIAEGVQRGKLIMACGTGKTFTSLKIAEELAGRGGRVLFLVPSLSLLSQTLTEWTQESALPLHSFAVCSDSDVGKKRKNDDDTVQTFTHELRYPATTSSASLAQAMIRRHDAAHMSVVFSTYHSIEVINQAQQHYSLADFDLIVCDEAHRTTGATFGDEDESHFVKVHDAAFIRASKRLYMTATPRIYGDAAKATAEKDKIALCSMDDPALYGETLHTITFSEAVTEKLLVDYKVIVLAIDAKHVSQRLQELLKDEDNQIKVDDAAKIVGCWKALSKQGLTQDIEDDTPAMCRAVAFCQVIEQIQGNKTHKVSSKQIASMFQKVVEAYQEFEKADTASKVTDEPGALPDPALELVCEAEHVDGSMNASQKESRLNWLKTDAAPNVCRILSNVRCLSEGVDVPALDAVLFLSPRNSQVEVVQSVGRVMRNAPGKKRGYVVLPVVIPSGREAHEALNDNKTYRVVWQVLQALRSHDDRFDAMINRLDLNGSEPAKMEVVAVTSAVPQRREKKPAGGGLPGGGHVIGKPGTRHQPGTTQLWLFEPSEIERAIYATVVKKCGNRSHWEEWATDIAKIAQTHITRIETILENSTNTAERSAFNNFAAELRDDLNDSLSDAEIVEMLAQHIITRPVFEALFSDYSFAGNNPISVAMQGVLGALEQHRLAKEADTLQKFYDSVKMRAEGITTAEGKQRIIVELYDKFFRNAFPRMTERLGIVYTPVEVVDFIIHSVNDILQNEFGQSLGSDGVHIIDPFAGTGTFITRLLQSGLMTQDEIKKKYKGKIHANELVLLAYYIATINIESTYHAIVGGAHVPFEGICLTDTFQMYEKEDLISMVLEDNSERRKRQKKLDIRVIMGNPPYSVGQSSANDNNQNVAYPYLDNRIRSTYAEYSTATNKNALYDSYIRAIRWASDRIGDSGVIGFVTNAGFVDANTADGLRKCLVKEFSSIYVFHLRGNQRTVGEVSRREGGKIFGGGSRAPIAISLLVKNSTAKEHGKIYFHDIGDYLSRENKLNIVSEFGSVNGIAAQGGWQEIIPDEHGDWIRQRDDTFVNYLPLGNKNSKTSAMFAFYSNGLKTCRDAWAYNFSRKKLCSQMESMIAFYMHQLIIVERLGIDNFSLNINPAVIKWSERLMQDLAKLKPHKFKDESIARSLYRPFCMQNLYYDGNFNERVYQVPRLFPSAIHQNKVIVINAKFSGTEYLALMSDYLPDLHCNGDSQCFPLFYYEKKSPCATVQGSLFDTQKPVATSSEYIRRDAITDEGLEHFKSAYPGESISKEDIFYYVYGLLHSEDYRTRYADNLSKELPRIPCVTGAKNFWAFSKAGRELGELHIGYETVTPYLATVTISAGRENDPSTYRVEKMKFAKRGDKSKVIYNAYITISEIPDRAWEYVINGKAALDWVMERQCVKTDKDSGIVNDANDWAIEIMHNPKYPLELFLRVITVSLRTLDVVAALPSLDVVSPKEVEQVDEQASVVTATRRTGNAYYSGRELTIREILPHIIYAQPRISQSDAFHLAWLATFPDACAALLKNNASGFKSAIAASQLALWDFAPDDKVRRQRIWGSLEKNSGVAVNPQLECTLSGEIQKSIVGVEAVLPYLFEARRNYELAVEQLREHSQISQFLLALPETRLQCKILQEAWQHVA